jgi:hypothetical protein
LLVGLRVPAVGGFGYASLRSPMRANRASSMARASLAPTRERLLAKLPRGGPPLEDDPNDGQRQAGHLLGPPLWRPLPPPGASGFWQ